MNITGLFYMTKMVAMFIYYGKKTFKNLILRNQKADNLETWCAALVTRVLSSIFKSGPWVDLDLHVLHIKIKNWSLLFLYGKMLKL